MPETVWMRRWAATLSVDLELLIDLVNGEVVEVADFHELGALTDKDGVDGADEVADAVLACLDDLLAHVRPKLPAMAVHALLGWRYALEVGSALEEVLLANEPAVHEELSKQTKGVAAVIGERMWRRANPSELRATAIPGLRLFVIALDDALADATRERIRVPNVTTAQARSDLERLVSSSMLEKLGTREITPVQRRAYTRIADVVRERQSMLVLAPPGSGKSRVGQVAAAHAVEAARRTGDERHALVLVPTKALVRENLQRWQRWVADEEPEWRVVAGSADNREYDEALAEGDFDVGIAVYEKLASLLFSQSRVLDRIGLIVVDELQNLGHRQKGVAVESLLTLLRLNWPHIPIVGLSASMSGTSVTDVCKWLDIEHLVETHARATDLMVHLFDGVTERSAVLGAALEDAGEDPGPAQAREYSSGSRILSRPDVWKGRAFATRAQDEHVKVPILQTLGLLSEPESADRRILCFVRDRDRAEGVSFLLREALSLQQPRPPAPAERNPWLQGRYARDMDPAEAEAAYKRLLHVDGHRWRTDARDGLLDGVAYHTRALESELRQILEEEFTGGLLRVLVCTDTLAEGVNLPASDVVVIDLTHYDPTQSGHVAISLAEYKNRIGRAGRLGTRASDAREQGHAWVFIDPTFDVRRLADATEERVISDVDDAWSHWMLRRLEDEALESCLGYDAAGHASLCGLILRTLAVHKHRYARDELLERIGAVMAATYWAARGGQADVAAIARRLEVEELLEPMPPRQLSELVLGSLTASGLVAEQEERLQITRLGVAIARSALPLESSITIQRIAENAPRLGDLSLLLLAACDLSVADTMGKWLGWRIDPNLSLELRRDVMIWVHAYARTYAHPDLGQRQANARLFEKVQTSDAPSRSIRPDAALVASGSAPLEREFADWLDGEAPDDVQVAGVLTKERRFATAVLRATIGYEWAAYQSWSEISLRLSKIATRRRDGKGWEKSAISGSPPDVAQLAEHMAYLLASASDFVADAPGTRHRLRALAEQVKTGLPRWLQPLSRLRERGLTREVILGFHRADREPTDDLERVLSTWTEVAVDPEVRASALQRYRALRENQEARYQRLPRRLEGRFVNDQGQPYSARFVEFLTTTDPGALSDVVDRLLRDHAIELDVAAHEQTVVCRGTTADYRPIALHIALEPLTEQHLASLVDNKSRTVVVPMRSPSWNVEDRLDRLDGVRASAVTPRALFVLLKELRERYDNEVDLAPALWEALGSANGFARHGHDLVELVTLESSQSLLAEMFPALEGT